MTDSIDHYKTLGVSRTASTEEIKRAYRKLAKEYHPDRNPDNPTAAAKFKEVQGAHDVLKDPDKRAQYDQFGDAGVGQWSTNPGGQRVYQWGGGSSVGIDDIEDLMSAFGGGRHADVFEEFLSGRGGRRTARGRRRPAPQRGGHVEQSVDLSLEQVAGGVTVNVQCPTSSSGGRQTLEVKIPAGVEDGQKIRLKGRGRPGEHGGPPGDLLLICSIQQHPYFRRQGPDILVEVPVSVTEAVLGARIEVPSLDGPATVTLPAGMPSGKKLRLTGRGLARQRGTGRGDFFAIIKIVPPENLSDQQKELYERLRDSDDVNPRQQCAWWKS